MMDIVHPGQVFIEGTVKTKSRKYFACLNQSRQFPHLSLTLSNLRPRMSEILEHLGYELMICKNGHRFLSLKLAGEKSRNNEHSLSVAKA